MQASKPKILIISSANPVIGPGVLATDWYRAFCSQGYNVDLLTLYKCDAHPEFKYVYDEPLSGWRKIWNQMTHHPFERICSTLRFRLNGKKYHLSDHYFFYRKEENPPVPVSHVLSAIQGEKYDYVHILFWQNMLSFATVRALYRHLKCYFVFGCVDYSPMSGGCHFTGDCERYKIGCGCCPAYNSTDSHDFTWHNVQYRKKVYEEVKPVVTGNSYMFRFYDESVLLKNSQRIKGAPVIDTNVFKPIDKSVLYDRFGVSADKTFKILFGCQRISDERKGIKYLIQAINHFIAELTPEEKAKVLVMSIGQDFGAVRNQLNGVDAHDFGFVSKEELPSVYAFADVFLCSSVNDAGPMMVNQALCCGTPVVGFEMGTCLDAVKDQGTGYCAKLKDSEDFANGILSIFRLTDEEKQSMSDRCVAFAQDNYSYEASVRRMMNGYAKYSKNSF